MKFTNKLIRPLVLKKARIISELCKPWVGRSVVDIGAGRAYIAKQIQKKTGAKITCVDIDNLNETDLPYILYDGKTLPIKDDSFDTALLIYVMHHCDKPEELLAEAARVAKRIIIFEDLGPYPLTQIFDYIANSVLYNVRAPLKFKRDKEWLKLFSEMGLNLKYRKKGVEKTWYYPIQHVMYVVDTT